MIKSELDAVWITSDGNKFVSKKQAIDHETLYNNNKLKREKSSWLKSLKKK